MCIRDSSNLGRGNVSGLSIAGLVAAACLVFGRFGWLGKIAGALLGMMLIGNNSGIIHTATQENMARTPVSYTHLDVYKRQAFKSKYSNHFPPSWITMEITSFGTLSIL